MRAVQGRYCFINRIFLSKCNQGMKNQTEANIPLKLWVNPLEFDFENCCDNYCMLQR